MVILSTEDQQGSLGRQDWGTDCHFEQGCCQLQVSFKNISCNDNDLRTSGWELDQSIKIRVNQFILS